MIALKFISFLVALKAFLFRVYFAVNDLKERVINAALQAEAQVLARVEEDRVTANVKAADRYNEFIKRREAEIELVIARHKDSHRAVTETLIATGEKLSKRGQAAQDRINQLRARG